ncbi:hypothetical protein OIU83_20515 [Flavobacterium sp. LS1R49]|uniref:Uncharacterized protein n=1 Tax=Flavobacterium shii TaxID=2987687 RepID=A0A9X3C005_9FLAO|nr:hypothetical protein [Flavobacterium shii]MCV9930056.1 hypothetical protein [Flavobacterium shii]
MLKKILKFEGAQELSKNEQKNIKGGIACGSYDGFCPNGSYCSNGPVNGIWRGLCVYGDE